jgi:hypothetical protein
MVDHGIRNPRGRAANARIGATRRPGGGGRSFCGKAAFASLCRTLGRGKDSGLTTRGRGQHSPRKVRPCLRVSPIEVYDGAPGVACILENISEGGAGLRFETNILLPPVFNLSVPAEQVDRRCEVMWRDGNRVGVSFV